ncbi:MAG: proline--tRNA ligase, partial [Terriglobales bacterium]
LPQIWYQIQTKFRDEPRPKSGLLRVRQFIMKDSYSFDLDAAGLDASYQKHHDTSCRIFDRCGLKYVVVEAHSGAMGGSQSHEFMVMTDAGEDIVASCAKCKYAANLEKASSRLASVEDLPAKGDGEPQPVETPGMKTIEDVARFLKVSPTQKIKTLAYMAGDAATPRAVVVFVRGDHTLNEAKLTAAVGGEFRPMHPEEIEQIFGSPAGYLGPLGTEKMSYQGAPVTVMVDEALRGRKNLVSGANRENYHLWNVSPERDFAVRQWVDLRSVEAGEGCPQCGEPLQVAKAVEIGHIFKLGYKYSESMGARVLAQDGKEVTPIMGSYGIGLERILTSTIEQNHDADGFWLPPQIAPFEVLVTPTNASDQKLLEAANQVAQQLEAAGHDVLLDDRDERPGVKFKDADLVGVPFRITVGKKVAEGKVEVVRRSTRETRDATIAEIGREFEQVFRAG